MREQMLLYGYLTSLVKEEGKKKDNFFKGLRFKDNFIKICRLINLLEENDIEYKILECYDYESDEEEISSFRFISFKYSKKLLTFLEETEIDDSFEISYDKKIINIIFD